ncbi:MAG: polysaccharide deacetylase family protein [Candidatus Hodarchaeota archaeon]
MVKGLIVCLTFDFDAEAAQIRQKEEPVRVSKGQFAIRRGIPRILSLLQKHKIVATFFVCGWVAEKYPVLVATLNRYEHEVAAHGYLHESLDTLPLAEEREIHRKTNEYLKELAGDVKGFRAPYWRLSPNTLRLIAEMGFTYDSSLMDEDRPYLYSVPGSSKKLVEFPVEKYLDDWVLFEEYQQPPSFVFETWKAQFDALLEMDDMPNSRRIFTLTFHPACIGHAYRLRVLEDLIEHMKRKKAIFSRMDTIAEIIMNE